MLHNHNSFEQSLMFRSATFAALSFMSEREQLIIIKRFGLAGYPRHTLDDLADEIGVSISRVMQLEARAIRKARHGFSADRQLASKQAQRRQNQPA